MQGQEINFQGMSGSASALSYPSTLENSKQDKMQFNMIKYVAPGLDNSNFGSPPRQQEFRDEQIIGRVFLPIPNGITDTTGASWGEGTMTPFKLSLAQVALQGIGEGAKGAIEALKDQVDKVAGNSADVKTALQTSIAGDAAGVQGLLTRTTGAILNPNLELLFQKPTLRPFDFTFKMSASNKNEKQMKLLESLDSLSKVWHQLDQHLICLSNHHILLKLDTSMMVETIHS